MTETRRRAGHIPALALLSLCAALAWPSAAQAQLGWLTGKTAGACGKEGPLTMPPGVDIQRLRLLDQGKRMAVYVAVTELELGAADKRRLPQAMQALVDLTPLQLNRLFADAVKASKRFAVFDAKATLTNEYANALVDLQVTDAKQDLLVIEPTRRAVQSVVGVSLNLNDMLSGEDLLGDAIALLGKTGNIGARLVLNSTDDPASPDVKVRLGADYVDALKDAFYNLRLELESRLRPMAKVLSAEGCDVGVAGGQKHGLQAGDELVVFRTQTTELGGKPVLAATIPVAQLKCDGVGTETSQCKVTQLVAGYKPSKEDYAVITTRSLLQPRQR